MFDLARAAVATAALTAALGLAPAPAAADVNLLVMGEDADPDTIERHTPIFDRVLEAISGAMRAHGVAVYDETVVTLDFYDQSRVRRTDAELISLARSVQIVPIDAVTSFEIHAATVPSAYEGITDLRLRIAGRVVAVADGLSLGGYEISYRPGELPMLPLNCDRSCQVSFVGDQAARIAKDVGTALAAQLAAVTQGTAGVTAPAATPAGAGCSADQNAFTLAFTGFDPDDIARFEAYLAAFQGYAHHKPLSATPERTEIWYETCADPARLARNLEAMFDRTGTEVWLEGDETGFSATRIAGPAAGED